MLRAGQDCNCSPDILHKIVTVHQIFYTIITFSQQYWFSVFSHNSCVWLKGFRVLKATLLFPILGTQTVSCRTSSVALTRSNKVSQILIKVLNLRVYLIAGMRESHVRWCISLVASIWQNIWVACGDNAICILCDHLFSCI